MNYSIIDIETDGLLEEQGDAPIATKIHCMSVYRVRDGVGQSFSLTSYAVMKAFLREETCLIGHNFKRYDIPVLEKFLNINLSETRVIDTLPISWYLYPARHEHGLEAWGVDLGISKPTIEDWSNLTIEEYIHRCEEDVKINTALFNLQIEYLKKLYSDAPHNIDKILNYLAFKMDCAREQEEQKWRLDIPKCKTNLSKLLEERELKIQTLSRLMPKVIKYKIVERPDTLYKKAKPLTKAEIKQGITEKPSELSERGKKWLEYLKQLNLPDYTVGPIQVPVSEEPGNPGSHAQVKEWLFSMGWKPLNVKIDKKANGEVKRIPQIANQEGNDVCESVKALYEKVPDLEAIEGLYIIKHRIGLLEGFLNNVDSNGYLKAQVKGLTNTLRFQHTTLVNLPTIPKPYWEDIRGCLITDEGYELCGSDMSSLEDNTKQHYMYFFDPNYVRQMRTPGFDPHIDIAVRAKNLSYDEGEFYKWYDKKKDGKEYSYTPTAEFNSTDNSILESKWTFEELILVPEETQTKIVKIIKPIRLKNKKGNFASVYGAGPPKLAITLGVPLDEAKNFHTAYWIRNKSVKQVSDNCIVKFVNGQMWLYNPVSQFWLSLREEKDRFSTLNQSTGVYCFDTWVKYVRCYGIKLVGQFHDEIIFRIPLGTREQYKEYLNDAIRLTNEELKLNVPLKISVDFGNTYAEIH